MRYAHTENPDGSITLQDYTVLAPLKRDSGKVSIDIGPQWMDEAITHHKTHNRRVFLFHGHNEMDPVTKKVTRYAPIVGYAEPHALYRDGNFIKAKHAVVTDPTYVGLFKRDVVGNQSAEFLESSRRLLGVAFIGGIPGHQDHQIPEPRLSQLASDLDAIAQTDVLVRNTLFTETSMPFTDEQKAEISNIVAEAVKQALASTQTQTTLSGDEDILKADDVPAALDRLVALKTKEIKHESDINTRVAVLLARRSNVFSEAALRKHLSKCETPRELESEFKRLNQICDKNEAVIALREDEDLADPEDRRQREAGKMFDADPEKWKALNFTRESFIEHFIEA